MCPYIAITVSLMKIAVLTQMHWFMNHIRPCPLEQSTMMYWAADLLSHVITSEETMDLRERSVESYICNDFIASGVRHLSSAAGEDIRRVGILWLGVEHGGRMVVIFQHGCVLYFVSTPANRGVTLPDFFCWMDLAHYWCHRDAYTWQCWRMQ